MEPRGNRISKRHPVLAALLASVLLPTAAAREPDAYDFLIPQFGEKAVEWAAEQTEETRSKLKASPNYARVLADMNALQAKDEPLPKHYLVAGRRFLRIERSKLRPYGRIEIADAAEGGLPGPWRTAFDLDAYSRERSVPFTMQPWFNPEQECRLPDYDRCMLPLFPEGGQENIFVEIDMATGKIVDDAFRMGAGRNFVSWFDRDTLLVAHTTEGAPALPSQFPAELKVWKRGTPLRDARTIFRSDPADSLFEFRVVGPPDRRRIILNVSKTYERFQVKELGLDGSLTDFPFPEALNNFGTPKISGRYLAVQLDAAAEIEGRPYPADAILSYDLDTGRIGTVMTPPEGVYLTGGFSATRSGFVIVGVRDLQRIVYVATPSGDGWAVRELFTEKPGRVLHVASDERSDTLLLREEGFLMPPRYALWDGQSAKEIASARPMMDLSDYTVDVRSAPSKDGTLVDYYLMRKSAAATGPTPTILQGYGGFGVNNDPGYFCCNMGASWKSWFDRGGALAMAAIRGGGERGGAWHRDAMGVGKIRSFEDFIAVAEDLQREGFTDAAHLGLLGHSEGGLLVAGTVVLRPDLYGAALVGAPITDNGIIGHGDGGIGAGLTSENGDWNDPVQREAMKAWDPYSNIRAGVSYPPVLATIATNDSQVGPSHARRFVARLRELDAPALLLEGSEGGHGYPDAYSQTADAALPMTFFMDHLMAPR